MGQFGTLARNVAELWRCKTFVGAKDLRCNVLAVQYICFCSKSTLPAPASGASPGPISRGTENDPKCQKTTGFIRVFAIFGAFLGTPAGPDLEHFGSTVPGRARFGRMEKSQTLGMGHFGTLARNVAFHYGVAKHLAWQSLSWQSFVVAKFVVAKF